MSGAAVAASYLEPPKNAGESSRRRRRRPLAMHGLCYSLCLVAAAAVGLSKGNRNCPDLVVDSCLCTAERSKGPGRQTLRIKVVCSGGDLAETLHPSLLPNRTVSL